MARGKGLAPGSPLRRVPLEPGGPIERKVPMPRGASPGRGGSLNSAAQRRPSDSTGPGAAVCRLVDARAAGVDVGGVPWCEWPGCTRQGTDRHHRLGRKAGGRHGEMAVVVNGAAWLLKACRPHHERVTSPVGEVLAEARAAGWLLMEGQVAEEVPVLTRHWPGLVLLDGEGCWATLEIQTLTQ